MHRILDALPADVHVKDTRCRYLYASRKLAQRTGIAQEDWIGKTIFEVLPATPRDHDKNAIEVMKSGKMNRIERSYETRKKSGWMETVQIPLVSDEGLIEGVVGLSFDTSDRKKKEQEILGGQKKVEQQLQRRSQELEKSQNEHSKAVTELRSTRQELRIRETELESQKREFEEQLTDRKRAEDLLRRSEEALLTRQKHLEEQLSTRLDELDTETDKRKKWEELLAIKESELKKLEECVSTRAKELEEEIARRTQTEADLKAGRTDLEQTRRDLKALEQQRTKEISGLTDKHDRAYGEEQTARKAAEKQLKKTATALESAQNRIQTLLEQHATELEHEVAERRNASTKLIQNAEELDELKRKFNERIEEETKALKKELAQKQIHEKALRQQSKDLESRIKELEKTLQLKIKENSKQIEAREGAEVQRQQVEQKLEHLTSRQRQLVERETQKLNLNIAEIRLEEIKLRKVLGELEQEKESLEHQLKERAADLDTSAKEKEKLETALKQAQAQCDTLRQEQQDLVTRETQALRDELKTLKKKESTLLKQEETLRQSSQDLKDSIKELSTKLTAETRNRQSVEKELEELQVAFTEGQENLASMIKEETKELSGQIEQHRQNEVRFKEAEQALRKEAEALQKTMDARAAELEDARKQCEKAELELVQVVERSSKGAKEIEAQIAGIKDEHQAEIKRIRDEQKEIRKKENYYRSLIQGSSDAFLQLDLKTGKVQFANLAAARLFGEETTKALTGKTMDALSPEHQAENALSADLVKARLHSALETGHESYEWQFNAVGQEPLHSLVSLSTVEIEENQVILALITDVSHLKKQQEDLQRSIAEAHEANRMNSRVVDEVTESVQEKLDPVVEATQLIEKAENLSEEQQHDMALINRNCRSLIDTLNYRRELSHVADGSNELTPEKCDLHEMIKELDQQFTHRAETKKIFFAVSYAQYQSANNVPKFVEADEHKVRTVLSILLGYALARTEKGRLGLHAARKSGQDDMISVGFELAYTGIEKKDELLSKVFDSENTGIEDMQYGLTLARRYVQMMDGHIELDYRQGDVTALTIELPFRKVASEILMPGKDDEAEAGAA
jgi:PAS domain S-box-containing protein